MSAPKKNEGEQFRQWNSDRVAKEIRDISERPIEGVRYDTITTMMKNDEELNVLSFELKKYGLVLEFLLPKKFPFEEPVGSFFNRVPQHPDVDQTTGRVLRFISNGVEKPWSPILKIRDLCAMVVDMLAEVNTPLAPPIPKSLREMNEKQFFFPLSPREFSFLCGPGMYIIDDLKTTFGHQHDCKIKFRGNKKKHDELVGLMIESRIPKVVQDVEKILMDHLVRKGFRDRAESCQTGETAETLAFFNFSPPSTSLGNDQEDLMSFIEIEPITYAGGDNPEIVGNEALRGRSLLNTSIQMDEVVPVMMSPEEPKQDGWDRYSLVYCPGLNNPHPVKKRPMEPDYEASELRQVAADTKAAFEQYNLARSMTWARISNDMMKLEGKVNRLNEVCSQLASTMKQSPSTSGQQRT